jgi:hypothetical protein
MELGDKDTISDLKFPKFSNQLGGFLGIQLQDIYYDKTVLQILLALHVLLY